MADIADEGNEITELATERAIARVQDNLNKMERVQATGYCLNPKCADDLSDGKLFCNATCAKQYEVYKK